LTARGFEYSFQFQMIVCLCHAVSDRKIEETIDAGATSLAAIERACGAGGDCGACQPMLAAMLGEACNECPRQRRDIPAGYLLPLAEV
jgi:bacterioferritin-associated ferredoxin